MKHRPVMAALGGLAVFALSPAGPAGLAAADPVDPFYVPPPPTVITYPVAPVANGAAMTPRQQTLPPPGPAPAAPPAPGSPPAPAAPPAPGPLSESGIPEIANPSYGSGKYGGGILGTLRDLWDQARNPAFVPDQIMGGPALPPGAAAPAPAGSSGGSAAERPALPPGYYPIDGPPPPGYEYLTPGATPPPG